MAGVGIELRMIEQGLGIDQALGPVVGLSPLGEPPGGGAFGLSAIYERVEVGDLLAVQAGGKDNEAVALEEGGGLIKLGAGIEALHRRRIDPAKTLARARGIAAPVRLRLQSHLHPGPLRTSSR